MGPIAQAIHLIGIILWIGGLFQVSRHLAQHAQLEEGAEATRSAFADWERTTYYFVSLPGLILTLGAGLYALFSNGFAFYLASDAWGGTFHMKLLFVVILIGADQFLRFKMTRLHDEGDGESGPFMAVHGLVAMIFMLLIIMMTTKFLA